MKNLKFLFAFLVYFAVLSCSGTFSTLPDGKQIDNRLVGEWAGSEENNQMEGVKKSWVMKRLKNGSFSLEFTVEENGDVSSFEETGTWWVENGKFYEFHDFTKKTDHYSYEVLNKNQVKFKAEHIGVEMNKSDYEFIDTRKTPEKNKKKGELGLSISNPIKVKSVPEEYQYIRENCEGCRVISQALINEGKSYYDELKVQKPDGTTVSYFFDINSFYLDF